MSEPNDKGLEEYLRRESDVSQRYRELEADDVPPQLDAAVIARARAAIEPNRRKPTWMKWAAPVALAASAVMVVAIVLEVGVQDEVRVRAPQVELTKTEVPARKEDVAPSVVQQAPVAPSTAPSAGVAPAEKSVAPKVTAEDAPADSAANAEVSPQRKRVESRAVSAASIEHEAAEETGVATLQQPAPLDASRAVAPPSASQLAEEAIAAQAQAQAQAPSTDLSRAKVDAQFALEAPLDSERRYEQVRNVPAGASRSTAVTRTSAPVSPAPAAPTAQVPRLPPEAWLEQIRTLRREGKVIEADQQWREFLESYPQFEVSATDSARPKP